MSAPRNRVPLGPHVSMAMTRSDVNAQRVEPGTCVSNWSRRHINGVAPTRAIYSSTRMNGRSSATRAHVQTGKQRARKLTVVSPNAPNMTRPNVDRDRSVTHWTRPPTPTASPPHAPSASSVCPPITVH